jgi:S1-C subfamily serine protease
MRMPTRIVIALGLGGLVLAGCGGGASTPTLPARLTEGQLIERATPGVLAVRARGPAGLTTGTAFVVDASQGLLVTAAHVTQGAANIKVRLPDRSVRPARRVGEQVCGDVALLQIVGDIPKLTTLPLSEGGRLSPNSHTILLHYGRNIQRFGMQGLSTSPLTIAIPIVDHPDLGSDMAPLDDLIQLQGVVRPSASGAPVLDRDGRVVGMVVLGETDASQAYAMRVEDIRGALPSLRSHTHQDLMGLAGASVRDVDFRLIMGRSFGAVVNSYLRYSHTSGFYATDVGGDAKRAGLDSGVLIQKLNGTSVRSMRGVCGVLDSTSPGDRVTVEGMRFLGAAGDPLRRFAVTIRLPR